MRILQVIDSLNPGGAERVCINISNLLKENNYDVAICTSRSGGSLQSRVNKEIRVYSLNKKRLADFAAFYRFFSIIKNGKFDLIHAHSTSIFWAVAVKILKPRINIIWHDHLGIETSKRKGKIFYRIISSKIDGIIVVSRELENWAQRNMTVPQDRIVYINNFPADNAEKRNPEKDLFKFVCLANLRPQKDHKTLLMAFRLLLDLKPLMSIKLVLAGLYKEDDYYKSLRELINDLNINSNIEITGSIEDTYAFLSTANCGILSSKSEGLPLSLLEYGMVGLPVIVTDVGQCAEVVGYGQYGHIVPPGDVSAMAEQMLLVMSNPVKSEEIGIALQNNIISNYGSIHFYKKYKVLLQKIACNA